MKNIKKLLLACMMLSAGHCPAINIEAVRFSDHIVQNWKPFSQRPNGIAPKAQPWRPGWKTAAAALGLTAAGAAAL
jgi:hypothetical protein